MFRLRRPVRRPARRDDARMTGAITRSPRDYRCFRISPGDSNRLAILFDPIADGARFIATVEIFDVGGRTPPNSHAVSEEMFYVLQGSGVAHCDGRTIALETGASLLLRPGIEHVIENTGAGRLYCLQMMVPNDGFAELIRNGVPAALD